MPVLIAARTQRHTCQSCPSASRRSLEWPARPSARPAAHWRTAMQMGLRGSDQATKPSRVNAQQGLLSRGSLARIMLCPLEWTRTNRLGAAPPFELMFTKTLASSDQIWVTAGCIVSFLRSPSTRRRVDDRPSKYWRHASGICGERIGSTITIISYQ